MVALCPKSVPVHRPRRPRGSPLYRIIEQYFPQFEDMYSERYEKRYGVLRPVIGDVVRKYLRCGDLHFGFARVRCTGVECGHEMFVPFSCRQRCLCPSCHQKRALLLLDLGDLKGRFPTTDDVQVSLAESLLPWYLTADRIMPGRLSDTEPDASEPHLKARSFWGSVLGCVAVGLSFALLIPWLRSPLGVIISQFNTYAVCLLAAGCALPATCRRERGWLRYAAVLTLNAIGRWRRVKMARWAVTM